MSEKSKVYISSIDCKDYIHPELHGQFIEHLGACIDGGIWVGTDSDIPNYNGIRKEVADALAKLEIPVLRWPGGCFADMYHWKDGIGDPAKRPVTFNTNFGTNSLEYNQFGTHEFMELCHRIHAKPWLNINLLRGSVEEMVDWAEYCNRPQKTAMAEKRIENGAEEPFLVEYWGIGNEAWAGGGTFTAEGYADAYRRYASSFPGFPVGDASNTLFPEYLPIKLVAVGPDGNKPLERVEWTKRFFRALEQFRMPKLDAYDLHFYNWNSQKEAGTVTEFTEYEWYRLIDGALEIEEVLLEQYELIQRNLPKEEKGPFARKHQVDLIIGEWGNWHPFEQERPALWQQNTMRDAITYALTLDIFHRNCDKVKLACLAQSVNVLGSLILTEGAATILTPSYHVFDMYKAHRDGYKAVCVVETETLFEGVSKVKAVNCFASVKEGVLTMSIVNTDMKQSRNLEISLDEDAQFIASRMLAHEDTAAHNTAENQEKVVPQPGPRAVGAGKAYTVALPKASITVLTFQYNG